MQSASLHPNPQGSRFMGYPCRAGPQQMKTLITGRGPTAVSRTAHRNPTVALSSPFALFLPTAPLPQTLPKFSPIHLAPIHPRTRQEHGQAKNNNSPASPARYSSFFPLFLSRPDQGSKSLLPPTPLTRVAVRVLSPSGHRVPAVSASVPRPLAIGF